MSISLDSALPERRATRRSFDRATGFDDASFVHDETRRRLLERLDLFDLEPAWPSTSAARPAAARSRSRPAIPAARVLAVDSSAGMLRARAASAAEARRRSRR